MIRYQWYIDLAFGFLPGILFRGQNLFFCKLLLFLDQNVLGGGGRGEGGGGGGREQKFLRSTPCRRNLYEIPRPGVSLVKAWEINLVFNLVLAWKFRKIE